MFIGGVILGDVVPIPVNEVDFFKVRFGEEELFFFAGEAFFAGFFAAAFLATGFFVAFFTGFEAFFFVVAFLTDFFVVFFMMFSFLCY